jgi:hypothetical protein
MALNSPGTQVTIIDESQYLPATPNSVPLIVLATARNKTNAAGTGIAVGTTSANANKLYQITSQRDLVTYFGNPFFYKTTNGTPIHGYELNEYGLLAAYSTLGSTNLAYVIRADIDLAEMVGRTGRPSSPPFNGQYWLNTDSSTWGIFEFNSVTGVFTNKKPLVITDRLKQATASGQPNSDIGNIGDYAINLTSNYGDPDSYQTYWFKNLDNQWVAVGSPEWQGSIPTLQGTIAPTIAAPVVPGRIVFATNNTPVVISGYIDNGSTPGSYSGITGTALRLTAATTFPIEDYTYISGAGIAPGTYITSGSGGLPCASGATFTVNIPQSVSATTITGYEGKSIITAASTVAQLVIDINSAKIPFVTAIAIDGKLAIFNTSPNGKFTITPASSPLTLASVGIATGTYNAPALSYGINAQQPLWRTTDGNPRPTGSVWIKTNNVNSGANLAVLQYDSLTASWTNKTSRIASNDWTISATLDATGGKSIPLDTVYAQAGAYETDSPIQLFSRAATGPSVFVGSTTTPSLTPSSSMNVYVSVPGSTALSDMYTVTMSPTGTSASDFVTSWTAANIPYTTAVVDTTGAIVLTHTEGGVIILDDTPSLYGATVYPSPVVAAGFTTLDPITGIGTLGCKRGPFKIVDVTPILPLNTTTVSGLGSGLTVRLTTAGTVPTFTIGSGGINYVTGDVASVTASGITYQIQVSSTRGSVATALTLVSGVSVPEYSLQLSNWEIFDYISDDVEPVNSPLNGTKWFHAVVDQVDILTNYGGKWFSYNNVKYDSNGLPMVGNNSGNNLTGPIVTASMPTAQFNGAQLVYGDLWIDTSDLENYPVISRWQNVAGVDQWVLIDNTDQTTENGVLFADARWGGSGSVDPVNDTVPTIISLLTNTNGIDGGAYVDLDAPSASGYPSGTLLFNTRRSGYVVKEFRTKYFNSATFPDTTLPAQTSAWVTVSGNKSNGAAYMGRKAQRAMVVQALKSCVDTNSDIREDQTFFNLIVCPGYPELQPNLVALNNDRSNTSYIIGDSPLRLTADANSITEWATNRKGATSSGEDGLVTRNTYLGIYYPSGITTDLTGTEVVVPASHMILRTMLYNDTIAYPWFAPAGQRRGIIDNANNIGYINPATGEFQTTQNRVALRDIEYTNYINPIAFFNNLGLLNFGNKNSFASQSALDRTNVARLVCYLRDRLTVAVRPFLFEPNDSMTRTQARGVCQTLLADIMSKRGIYDYLVVCDESNNTPARIDRNELWIDIAIEPVKAVEFIYIPVRILNTGEIGGL